ncbi:putative 5'(3')-deoxyribonucleotidase [compost metagenome]
MDWWRQQWLYQDMEPIEDSIDVLEELSEWFDIVVVSASKAAHFKGKYHWVKNHFPFVKGFYATKEKGGIRADIAVDDRNEYLLQYDSVGVHTIRYATPHRQNVEFTPNKEVNNWRDVYNYLNRGI